MNLQYWLDILFPPREDEAVVRELTIDNLLALMEPYIASVTKPNTIALLPFFDQLVRSAIHEAKYHENAHALDLLASVLTEYLQDADEELRKPIIVPIPLGAKRRKERGYNQVEEVAKRAARELPLLVDTNILVRTRETESQVSLPRERRKANMRGAFGAAHPLDPSRTYILLDDVVTTGATLQAAISALKSAGAKHIVPLALAH